MREIECRVWDKQDKQYRKIAALTFGGKYVYLYPGEGCRLTPEDERHGMCGGAGFKMTDLTDRDRLVFEQYTGLKDKNGKKIYEGDIVKVEDKEDIADVNKFCGYNAVVEISTLKPGAFIVKNWYGERILNWDILLRRIEVIGNVHENPELLEEVKND